jgi:hypothetical protein
MPGAHLLLLQVVGAKYLVLYPEDQSQVALFSLILLVTGLTI